MGEVFRVRGGGLGACGNGCSSFVGTSTVRGRLRLGGFRSRRGSVGGRRRSVRELGTFNQRGRLGETEDGRGTLTGISMLSGPRTCEGGTGVRFGPSIADKGSILRLESVSVKCKREVLFGSLGLSVCQKRGITLVNTGNVKGSALFGVVVGRVAPLSKSVGFKAGIGMSCFRRRRGALGLSGAVVSRV